MCEIFGINSKTTVTCNETLKEFYGHSVKHPHGWGLAVMDNNDAEIIKEPMQASRSFYLHERLTVPVSGSTVLAHIRYATIGNIEYRNCHPFTGRDESGRRWTMIHNGTIFDYPPLQKYLKKQQGDTDSERIFLHILHEMNQRIRNGSSLHSEERFQIMDELVTKMSVGNKLNLLLFDGRNFYVHTNSENTLYMSREKDFVKVCTTPLGKDEWEPVPMTTLLVFRDGNPVYTGTNHGHSYSYTQEDIDRLYQIFANL